MRVAVLGAGMMARAVVSDLVRAADVTEIRVADHDDRRLRALCRHTAGRRLLTRRLDLSDSAGVADFLEPCDVAVSCVPYFLNARLTRIAIATRTHFCDLGGNNDVVREQLSLHERARARGITVVPDCGLAPGLVGILAADGIGRLTQVDAVHLRVGGLPRNPKPPLGYGIVFSALGLINEYTEECEVLRNGRPALVEPLADVESLRFPAPFGRLEAFTTSGGSSTLPRTFHGRVRTLDYKTIRYPGHCERFRLLHDLGLLSDEPVEVDGRKVVPRLLLARLLEDRLGFETDDVVLLRVDVLGRKNGQARRIRYQLIDRADPRTGLTAMMRCTGFPAAVTGLMLGRGQALGKGVLPGEKALPAAQFIRELSSRGIDIRVTTRTA